jgi:hypothetical protein
MKYVGKCDKHGLIQHDVTQAQIDIKGGPYCPYCGSLVDVIAKNTDKKNPRTNDRKD